MMKSILISVPLWPLMSALLILLFKKPLGRGAGYVALAGVSLSLIGLLVLRGEEMRTAALWMPAGGLRIEVGLMLDGLSRYMSLLVAGVSFGVTLYAVGYMAESAHSSRFFVQFSFFIGAMLALVLASSFLLLYGAWECVGLASFLLIGYRDREKAAQEAAKRAFLMTRLGDMGLLMAWVWALLLVGSTGIPEFLKIVEGGGISETVMILMAVFFLAAAVGKSAQLPLTAWLPDAMVGPSPVSALLHSATMVAAGAYLLLRLFPLFSAAPGVLIGVAWIGGITTLFAALVATSLMDFKRILAWSTVSHLGKMMLSLGLGGPVGAAYHLGAHACFKSTLFLTAGAVERGTGTRDLRKLGGLAKVAPLTAVVAGLAALALAGVPPFSGYWSEDVILGAALSHSLFMALFMLLLIVLSGVYIGRAVTAVFGEWHGSPLPDSEQPSRSMGFAMAVLGAAAALFGLLLHGGIEKVLPFESTHSVPLIWKGMTGAAAVVGLGVGIWRVNASGPVPAIGPFPKKLTRISEAVATLPVKGTLALAGIFNRIEAGLNRSAGGLVHLVLSGASGIRGLETGFDRAAAGLTSATFEIADAGNVAEIRGFSDGLDAFGGSLARAGYRLKEYQTGKLYHYTLGLAIWVLALGVIAVVMVVMP